MWNGISSCKQYRPDLRLSRPAVLAAALAAVTLAAGASTARPGARPQPAETLTVPGTGSEAHRRLFTPRAAPADAYVVKVLPLAMAAARAEVMRSLGVPDPGVEPAFPGGAPAPWSVRRLEVFEAFGSSGPYEPTRLARLFNGRRAEVCRGPVLRDGRTVASVTLVSPYPDPTFSRLEPGTLVILLRL